MQEAAAEEATSRRAVRAQSDLSKIWDLCKARCSCTDADHCPIRTHRATCPADAAVTCPRLRGQPDQLCPACVAFSALRGGELNLLGNSGTSRAAKNARLRQLLKLCPAVHGLFELALNGMGRGHESGRPKSKKSVTNLLGRLLCCGSNRVHCLRSVGRLSALVPRVLTLTSLESGWSLFWTEVRKISKAVSKQPDRQAAYAALIAIRLRCTAQKLGRWDAYLTSGSQEEQDVMQRFFVPLAQ